VRIGVHQRMALSSYLFSVVMDVAIKKIEWEVQLCMLFVDDVVLVGESWKEVNQRLIYDYISILSSLPLCVYALFVTYFKLISESYVPFINIYLTRDPFVM